MVRLVTIPATSKRRPRTSIDENDYRLKTVASIYDYRFNGQV
jgi:hypothetical protein